MQNLKLGLKLFTNQHDFYKEKIIKFWEEKKYSYIEIFVNPDQMEYLPLWENLKNKYEMPFTIHAPQYSEGVNLSDSDNKSENMRIYAQVKDYSKAIDAMYVVSHCGMDGNLDETIKQLNMINLPINVENIPYCSRRHPEMYCQGSTVEEIEYVRKNTNCGFCLDVGHAFCSAVILKKDKYEYLKQFNALNPDCYHLSDGEINNKFDIHLNINKGDYDWKKIIKMLNKNKNMTLETILKSSKTQDIIEHFEQDTEYLQKL